MHPYWKESEEQAKRQEQVQFSRDLSLAGGALAFWLSTPLCAGKLGITITQAVFEL